MLENDQPGTGADRPLSILQFVMTLGPGGAEKLAADLSIGLREKGHRVTVAAWHDPAGAVPTRLRDHGVELVPITFPKPGILAVGRTVRDVRSVLARLRPDIVHAHNPGPGTITLVARTLARQPRLPIVTTYHGVRPHRLELAGRVMARTDGVIAVGPTAAAQLRDVLPDDAVTEIRNAVYVSRSQTTAETRKELGVSDEQLLFVSVGRHVAQKGQSLLLEAAAELRRRGNLERPFQLVVVGEGPLMAELEAQAAALGCDDCVTFTGPRTDAVDLIAAADALLHTAHWEGLPLVLLEAMSVGTPIVAVDAVGVGDIIRDGVTGMLVGDRDPESFAEAVERLAGDSALRASLIDEGHALIDRDHRLETMIDRHVSLYRRLIDKRSGTGSR